MQKHSYFRIAVGETPASDDKALELATWLSSKTFIGFKPLIMVGKGDVVVKDNGYPLLFIPNALSQNAHALTIFINDVEQQGVTLTRLH